MNTFNDAGIFLVSTLFDLYLSVLIIRLILVWVRTDYYNPISQFVIKLTKFLVNPVRRIIPNIANIELSCLVIFLLIELLKFFLICLMTFGLPHITGLLILAFASGLKLFLSIFFYAILITAILSWIHAGYSPVMQVAMQITAPILRPLQRLIPPIAGFDISPIPAMLILQFCIILISPLFVIGMQYAT